MALFTESDAPPLPQGTVPVEVVNSNERITYAEWFRWMQRQGSGIGLLLNADLHLNAGRELLGSSSSVDRSTVFLAVTCPLLAQADFHRGEALHWTQAVPRARLTPCA